MNNAAASKVADALGVQKCVLSLYAVSDLSAVVVSGAAGGFGAEEPRAVRWGQHIVDGSPATLLPSDAQLGSLLLSSQHAGGHDTSGASPRACMHLSTWVTSDGCDYPTVRVFESAVNFGTHPGACRTSGPHLHLILCTCLITGLSMSLFACRGAPCMPDVQPGGGGGVRVRRHVTCFEALELRGVHTAVSRH